jgi:type 1 glutamine amidotransferase
MTRHLQQKHRHNFLLKTNRMRRYLFFKGMQILAVLAPVIAFLPAIGQQKFKAVAFYTTTVESDHVDFARDAIAYYSKLAAEKNFVFDTTTNWANINTAFLNNYQVVLWLNDFPQNDLERKDFEQYMEGGGAWLGFHVAAYNDKYTKWKWFVNFLGGGVFNMNNWPPLPAMLVVDDQHHPVTAGMPANYKAPINEWYQWVPSPRLNKDVKVLLSLDPSNFPLGKKDFIPGGDVPVVWSNTKYRMLYMNMGHGDKIFTDSLQNQLFSNAIMWLGQRK